MEECRHIRINGTKCRSAALNNQAWCYFHDDVYRRRSEQFAASKLAAKLAKSKALTIQPLVQSDGDGYIASISTPATEAALVIAPLDLANIDLPVIEDISSIQLAISRILQALACNSIDSKRAGLLLYGLQIAAQYQPKANLGPWDTVSDVGKTDDGIDVALAPPGEDRKETFHQLAARLRLNLRLLDELESKPKPRSSRPASRKTAQK